MSIAAPVPTIDVNIMYPIPKEGLLAVGFHIVPKANHKPRLPLKPGFL